LRIIAGYLGGRQFNSPRSNRTHPMSDKARGGLFNSLGDISDLTILDAFAGSGALSFEAISRGAESVIAVDIDKNAYQAISESIKSLDLKDRVKAIRANISGWSDNNPDMLFDIVIAAPPYDDLQAKIVEKITSHVKPGGLYILDWPAKQDAPDLPGLKMISEHDYGDAKLIFFRR
jgi:16S rRNA (guanine966-N2)-methyltransferase